MTPLNTTRRRLLTGGLASLAAAGLAPALAAAAPKDRARAAAKASGQGTIPRRQRVKALVIGSGFGGAVAAYRLGLKGVETLVLERGRRWDLVAGKPGPFATSRQTDGRALWLSELDLLATDGPKDPLDRYTGLVERYNEDGIIVWASSGVGGGSLVYNTVLLQPSKQNFALCFPAEVSYEEMDREYYPRVVEMMDAGPIPDDILMSSPYLGARVFQEFANRAGLRTERINTATNWHVVRKELRGQLEASAIAGEIWYGANSGYKNSLDRNYLKYAQETGHVNVQELSNVVDIKENGSRYIVEYNRLDERGNVLSRHTVDCDYLFLGAGSMGTTSLLMRAKHRGTLPRLNAEVGRHWGDNGDTFASIKTGRPAGANSGGPAHLVGLDYESNPYGPQTVIAFPMANRAEDVMTFLGMSIPQQSGHWDYDVVEDRAKLHWPNSKAADAKTSATMEYTLKRIASAITPESAAQSAVDSIKVHVRSTAHPCGGAVMGQACDFYGRVQGYKGLYVVDGALIPLGTAAANPALTIGALAERCMAQILKTDIRA